MVENQAPIAVASATEDKLIGIELLRFASALAVLVFHYQHFAFQGTSQRNFDIAMQPFYPLLHVFYKYGFYGVQVFWCISGFIFFWKYGQTISQRRLDGRKFLVLRASRLYPLHFATLLFVAVAQHAYFSINDAYFIYPNNDVLHFVLQLFMASNWDPHLGDSFNGPIWSISIEVLVYCVFFFNLRYISGSVLSIVCVIGMSTLISFLRISTHPVFNCLMFFYIGCLTAIVYAKVKDIRKRSNAASWSAVAAIAALFGAQAFMTVKPIYFLLVFSPALIFLSVTHIPATKLISRLLVAAGSMTYSSYLLHVPIQLTVATLATYTHRSIPIYNQAFFAIFILGTLALSFYCYKYFEIPAQNYLRRPFK